VILALQIGQKIAAGLKQLCYPIQRHASADVQTANRARCNVCSGLGMEVKIWV